MASINTFEDIEAWIRARKLSSELNRIFQGETAKHDYGLKDQVNRSIGSVMDNIAEGFERGGNKEFIQFLFIAKGSAGEARSQLYRILDRNYLTQNEFNRMSLELSTISVLLMNFINYLKNSEFKGSKYHEPQLRYGDQI